MPRELLATLFLTLVTGNLGFAADENLPVPVPVPVPLHVAVGGTKQQIEASILAARRYAAFWNTGNIAYAAAALAPAFIDQTLPPRAGRKAQQVHCKRHKCFALQYLTSRRKYSTWW